MKMKIIYKESYKSPGAKIKDGLTPVCRHQAQGFDVSQANILAAGVCEIDGEKLEFQDIRVWFKEREHW